MRWRRRISASKPEALAALRPEPGPNRLSKELFNALGNKLGIKITEIKAPELNDVSATEIRHYTTDEVRPQDRREERP